MDKNLENNMAAGDVGEFGIHSQGHLTVGGYQVGTPQKGSYQELCEIPIGLLAGYSPENYSAGGVLDCIPKP